MLFKKFINKISTKTRVYIEKFLKPNNPVTIEDDDEEDQAIYVETRFKEIAANQLSIYNNENPITKQFKSVNHNNDCDMLFDLCFITSENFYENSTVIRHTSPISSFIRDQKNKKPSPLRPFQPSNRNNQIELIDLTDC